MKNFRIIIAIFIAGFLFNAISVLAAEKTNVDYADKLAALALFFNDREGNFVDDFVDLDFILEQSFKHVETDEKFKQGFLSGFKNKAQAGLAHQLLRNVPEDGEIKLIKQTFQKGKAEGTFRFDYGDNGFGYMRFIMQQRDDNEIKIVDWFDYATGQRYTDNLANIIRSVAPGKGLVGRIKDLFSDKNVKSDILMKLSKMVNANNFDKLEELFNDSRTVFQNDWVLMSTLVHAANLSNNDAFYRKALQTMATYFGDDERSGFMLLDHYFFQNDVAKVLQILDRYSEIFEQQDAAIYLMKANIYLQNNRFEEAHSEALKSIAIENDFADGYWNLVTIAITQKNYVDAVKHLTQLATKFGYQFERSHFQNKEFYNEFVQSDAFQQWLD